MYAVFFGWSVADALSAGAAVVLASQLGSGPLCVRTDGAITIGTGALHN